MGLYDLNYGTSANTAAPQPWMSPEFSAPSTIPAPWSPTQQFDLSSFGSWKPQPLDPNGSLNPANVSAPAAQFKWGNNIPTWGLGFQGLSALTNLWQGLEANKIAKQSLSMQRDFGNANLNNSISAYNTSLENKAAYKADMQGWSDQQKADYIAAHKATR